MQFASNTSLKFISAVILDPTRKKFVYILTSVYKYTYMYTYLYVREYSSFQAKWPIIYIYIYICIYIYIFIYIYLSSQFHSSGAFHTRPFPIVESSAPPHVHLPLVLITHSPPGHPIPCCRYLELSGGEERATSPLQFRVGSEPYPP